MDKLKISDEFGQDYYRRYYQDPQTRVADPSYYRRLARFIRAYVDYLEVAVGSIVDLGCGAGTLKTPLCSAFKKASYQGVENSAYACQKYGWEHACASTFWAPDGFDLVICHDVMQYLDDARASAAIDNFGQLTSKVLYFSVLTREDWAKHVDQDLTDNNVYLRKAAWYRKRLQANFKNVGGGVYIHHELDAVVYELEGGAL